MAKNVVEVFLNNDEGKAYSSFEATLAGLLTIRRLFVTNICYANRDLNEDLAKQQKIADTIREARTAVNLDPNNPKAHMILGDALAETGDAMAAQSEYAAALQWSDLDPVFQKELARRASSKDETLNGSPSGKSRNLFSLDTPDSAKPERGLDDVHADLPNRDKSEMIASILAGRTELYHDLIRPYDVPLFHEERSRRRGCRTGGFLEGV
jgi:hypothetical protein